MNRVGESCRAHIGVNDKICLIIRYFMCTLMWNELVIRLAWGYHMAELDTFDLSCINLAGAVHHSGEETRYYFHILDFPAMAS